MNTFSIYAIYAKRNILYTELLIAGILIQHAIDDIYHLQSLSKHDETIVVAYVLYDDQSHIIISYYPSAISDKKYAVYLLYKYNKRFTEFDRDNNTSTMRILCWDDDNLTYAKHKARLFVAKNKNTPYINGIFEGLLIKNNITNETIQTH